MLADEAADRSRALMWDVPRYLEAMRLRGRPVLAGVVENVTDVRAWAHWHAWVAAIHGLGYRTRLIALNSMHAVAHTLLGIAWAVMRYDGDYLDAGADYYERRDQRNREHLARHYQQALARLGYQVTLTPPGDDSPPPTPATTPAATPHQAA